MKLKDFIKNTGVNQETPQMTRAPGLENEQEQGNIRQCQDHSNYHMKTPLALPPEVLSAAANLGNGCGCCINAGAPLSLQLPHCVTPSNLK